MRKTRRAMAEGNGSCEGKETALSRPFTKQTRWIICVWDIRGEQPAETARMMRRPLREIEQTLLEAREDGYYEKVRRYLDDYDQTHARKVLEGIAALMGALEREEKTG
ncbi:MAG: hypothetical protein E7409_02480 [Ruminococcaceae bacterium]|nr:hypothetical protein [Oscillospiraceae bacterium]